MLILKNININFDYVKKNSYQRDPRTPIFVMKPHQDSLRKD